MEKRLKSITWGDYYWGGYPEYVTLFFEDVANGKYEDVFDMIPEKCPYEVHYSPKGDDDYYWIMIVNPQVIKENDILPDFTIIHNEEKFSLYEFIRLLVNDKKALEKAGMI